jgi:hypothetical protein
MFEPLKELTDRHSDEIKASAAEGAFMLQIFGGVELSEREQAIFEVAYANGYSDAQDNNGVEAGEDDIHIFKQDEE